MLNLYNRTARRLAEDYLVAMNRLDASATTIAATECLARALSDAGIQAEAEWQLGAGCQLRVPCAIEVLDHTIHQIGLALAMAGFGMVTTGQTHTWALIDTRDTATPLTITLIIEEF